MIIVILKHTQEVSKNIFKKVNCKTIVFTKIVRGVKFPGIENMED